MNDDSWQQKITRARWVETKLCRWYQDNIDPSSKLPETYTKMYDIIVPKLHNVEVKEDLLACHTENYAIEFENYDGEPSGINVTTSGEFTIVDHEYVIRMATDALRYILSQTKDKRVIPMGFMTQEGKRCKGWLIPRTTLLSSAYADIKNRWF